MSRSLESSEISSYLLKMSETKARQKIKVNLYLQLQLVRNYNTESEEEILKDWRVHVWSYFL